MYFFSLRSCPTENSELTGTIGGIFLVLALLSNSISAGSAQQSNLTRLGVFNSTQTDPSGDIEWLNSGNWTLKELNSLILTFNATIDMKRLNGSELHSHKVNNLVITMAPIHDKHSEIIHGRTLITMQGGFVSDVPTEINLTGNNMSLYFNPNKIENHFGNQSIYGSILK
jgi:hypothetical protein